MPDGDPARGILLRGTVDELALFVRFLAPRDTEVLLLPASESRTIVERLLRFLRFVVLLKIG